MSKNELTIDRFRKLEASMKLKGISAKVLCGITGLNASQFSLYRHGKRSPSLELFSRLEQAVNEFEG